jgi:hypothetical protein
MKPPAAISRFRNAGNGSAVEVFSPIVWPIDVVRCKCFMLATQLAFES